METEGLAKIFLSVVFFLFIAFSFPTLQTAIANANSTIVFYPVLQAFPYVLLALSIGFPFLFLYQEKEKD